MNSKDLRAKRAKLVNDARMVANKRGATAEDFSAAERMLVEADALKTQIDRIERVDTAYASLSQEIRRYSMSDGSGFESDPARDKAIMAKLARGAGNEDLSGYDGEYLAATVGRDRRILTAMSKGELGSLSAEDQAHYTARYRVQQVQNAGATTSTTGGGYTVAPLFEAQLTIALKAFGGVRTAARNIQTATGATLPWPTMDDTGNVATILGTENTSVGSGTDLAFGQTAVGAYTYVSGAMPVSLQLLQDSVFDFDSLIETAMVTRFGRGQNAHFTNGSGVGQPQGVTAAAALGKTGAAGQTTSVLWTDLVDLEHSVDPAYRKGASWMLHDSTLKAVAKFTDSIGRPLWLPGLDVGAPDTILGYPYVVNQDMPVMVTGARSILFGDFKNYLIRDALGLQIMVLRERYADQLQVAWSAFTRADGRFVSAAQPIKYYANALS
jgi:HK97 family phage major capsid protein